MSFNATFVRLTFSLTPSAAVLAKSGVVDGRQLPAAKIRCSAFGGITHPRGDGFGEISRNPNQGEESYGESERKRFHRAGNNARGFRSDRIGGWLGVWTEFLGGDLRLRARQHRSSDPGN